MCIACNWGRFRGLLELDGRAASEFDPSRRQLLQAGATFAATGVAAAMPMRAEAAAGGKADIVFRNGPVYTVNGGREWARAVAVAQKRIVYVGDDTQVSRFIGPKTRVVDLAGRMLLPGFIEGHIHPISGAAITSGIDLQYDTRDDMIGALTAYRDKLGKVEVVRGFGWRYHAFPFTGPRKEDLDQIWPDTPVFLAAIDGHCAWINSKALAMAKITKATKDPLPGFSYFQRDKATGEPTGYVVEVPAMMVALNAAAPFTSKFITESLEAWLPKASAAGITTVFDAGMQILPEAAGFQLYQDLEGRGKLSFRVIGSTYHNNPAVDPVPIIKALRKQFHSELVQASVLKLNIDGGEAQRTSAMLAPYDDDPKTSGETLLPPDLFKDIILRADRDGFNIHIHCCGDRGARLCLDAFEAAMKANPPRDRRHTVCHLVVVAPEDLPRFAALGVTAEFSAQWAVPDPSWRDVVRTRLGARADTVYRIGSILRDGGNISFGTDWPAAGHYSTFRPLEAIEIATTRRELNRPDQPPLVPLAERISLDQALRAATMGPAYQLGLDRKIGSIEVGKLADLVVLEKNLFEVAPHDIHKTKVVMTVMNGQIRHE
ncbi:putative amidohydrolase 3 precursor [Bradyrhizobium sp. ORS 285]|uniref:amidohydrolase n=1 Tax=Bradyrhizobium sp. ORS 285 TaxID=115808 RepID=UPI000240797B|nr:amidohydrolase [Bradyrhizobium sp. ORS 285]CCD89648.1 putative amidohydrolase 3 precursor [Bradyrhizobium sp. ORS 285]SMX56327.1 putative amidohydrolase 3 precursor [Bradyrhizobium sp. ORS 285]